MSKPKKEEPKKETQTPENSIATVQTTRYHIRFNGRPYELRAPLVPLSEIIELLEFFKVAAEKTLAERQAEVDVQEEKGLGDKKEELGSE